MDFDACYALFSKTADEEGFVAKQVEAYKAMKSDKLPGVAKPELIQKRVFEGFKMGALAGLLAASIGAAAGAPLGVADIGALFGGYGGFLGGTVAGQGKANKDFLKERGFDPKHINIFRYTHSRPDLAYAATTLLPESGHLTL